MMNLLEFLALCLLHFPLIVGLGLNGGLCSGDCNCRQTVPGPCDGCTGDLTPTYQMVFDGIVDDNCTGCNNFNITFVTRSLSSGCTRDKDPALTVAASSYGVVPGCVALDGWNCVLHFYNYPAGSGVGLTVHSQWQPTGGTANFIRWKYTAATVDCTALADFSLAFETQTSPNACNGSSSTCEVSSI